MTRILYPRRDTMRAAWLIEAGKWIGWLLLTACVVAFYLGPDAVVSLLTN